MTQLLRSASLLAAVFMTFVGVVLTAQAGTSAQGWYLVHPPHVVGPPWVDESAPMSEWIHYATFDTAVECERARQAAAASEERRSSSTELTPGRAVILTTRCVSANDPRLR